MLYLIFSSIAAFGVAALFGYVVFPLITKKELLAFFLSRATDFEAHWRDRFFLPLTRRMTFVSPNFVTTVGFLLTGVVLYLFWIDASFEIVFLGVFLAGFTDMLDGPLARNNNCVTVLGARLDWSRDLLLTIVTGVVLVSYGVFKIEFLVWILTGWAVLGMLRILEFKITTGAFLNSKEDYKFILDRLRVFTIWLGALFLMLGSYYTAIALETIGEILTVSAIAMSWCSVLVHAAHVRMLQTADVPHSQPQKTTEGV